MAAPGARTSRSALDVVSGGYSAFLDGGPDALLDRFDELFASDFEFHPALIGGLEGARTYVGRDGFADYWREFRSVFSDPEFGEATFESLGGDRVLAGSRIRARGATSGTPFDQEAAYVFAVRDGRIAEMRTFFSRADALAFAGVLDSHTGVIADMVAFFDAMERGDRKTVFELVERRCHPDCEITSAVSGPIEGAARGHEEIKEFFASTLDVWDLSYANQRFASLGADAVVVRHAQTVRGRRSDIEFNLGGGVIWWLEGDRAIKAVTYTALARAVAAIEAPDA